MSSPMDERWEAALNDLQAENEQLLADNNNLFTEYSAISSERLLWKLAASKLETENQRLRSAIAEHKRETEANCAVSSWNMVCGADRKLWGTLEGGTP